MTLPSHQPFDLPAEPPPPGQRPRRRRTTARVLLVDTDDRVLLFEDSDLLLQPVRHWWITPGGGVDPGESTAEAAVREIAEETGLVITETDLVGPLAVRQVVHGYSDVVVDQHEVYYLVRSAPFVVDASRHTEEERLTVHDIRWWRRKELLAERPEVWPAQLLEILDLAATPERWRAGPLDLGRCEESTVPA